MKKAEIHTDKGIMHVEFFDQDAPKTVDNFIKLSKDGYYDGLTFHRVIPNFVIHRRFSILCLPRAAKCEAS